MMQHALKLCNRLHLVDVGAVIDRPRAINNRPYGFYREFFVFRNGPFYQVFLMKRSLHLGQVMAIFPFPRGTRTT